MSELKLEQIGHPDAVSNSLTFDSDGSLSVNGSLSASSITSGGSSVLTSASDSSDFPSAILTSISVLDSDQIGAGSISVDKLNNSLDLSSKTVLLGGNITGTVTQSGGTPTGPIIESGSNSNGKYTRFADGTQICFANPYEWYGSEFYDGPQDWTFPASFDETPTVVGTNATRHTPADIDAVILGAGGTYDTNTTRAQIHHSSTRAQNFSSTLIAIGRWF